MKFHEIHEQVKGVPFISERNARRMYDMIIEREYTSILELGIAHGTATCYMAAALDEIGRGHIDAVDLASVANTFQPSAESQLQKTCLEQWVTISRMETGYNWFLHNEICKQTHNDICEPKYDLCIIDGPKNWTIDGCAFFLSDKLLKENGLLIFDDYLWTYASADDDANATDGITHRELSEAEFQTPQIKEVFELLVKQHPNYSHFEINADGNWAMARKSAEATRKYTVVYDETIRDFWGYACRRLGNRLFPKA